MRCDVCTDTGPPVLSPIQEDQVMYSKSLTQGDYSRMNDGSGNQISALVQALAYKPNTLLLGYRTWPSKPYKGTQKKKNLDNDTLTLRKAVFAEQTW